MFFCLRADKDGGVSDVVKPVPHPSFKGEAKTTSNTYTVATTSSTAGAVASLAIWILHVVAKINL